MLKQYSVLSKCLSELKKSDLPLIDKLRLEVDLIQTKRLLLDQAVELRVAGLTSSEVQFDNMYEQVRYVCNNDVGAEGMDRLRELLLEIKGGLSFVANGRNAYSLQSANDKTTQSAARKTQAAVKDYFLE